MWDLGSSYELFFLFVSPVDILEFLFSSSSIYLILPQHRGTIIDILLRFDFFFVLWTHLFFPTYKYECDGSKVDRASRVYYSFFLIQKVHFVVVTRRLRFWHDFQVLPWWLKFLFTSCSSSCALQFCANSFSWSLVCLGETTFSARYTFLQFCPKIHSTDQRSTSWSTTCAGSKFCEISFLYTFSSKIHSTDQPQALGLLPLGLVLCDLSCTLFALSALS